MSTGSIEIGPHTAIYVGDAAPAGNGVPLTLIEARRTKGSLFNFHLPTKYEQAKGSRAQSGAPEVSVDLRFLGQGDGLVKTLCHGNTVASAPNTGPSALAQYILLLVDSDPNSTGSILIPVCSVDPSRTFNRQKQAPTETPLLFQQTGDRNRFKDELYYDGTLAELLAKSEMSGRSPF